jgi:hypothetical protein
MEVIWQVTDDNSTVNDVGRGRGAQETLDMGGGRQWRGDETGKFKSARILLLKYKCLRVDVRR